MIFATPGAYTQSFSTESLFAFSLFFIAFDKGLLEDNYYPIIEKKSPKQGFDSLDSHYLQALIAKAKPAFFNEKILFLDDKPFASENADKWLEHYKNMPSSPQQQFKFLTRFLNQDFPLLGTSYQKIKELAYSQTLDKGWNLFSKTAFVKDLTQDIHGYWVIGWLENGSENLLISFFKPSPSPSLSIENIHEELKKYLKNHL